MNWTYILFSLLPSILFGTVIYILTKNPIQKDKSGFFTLRILKTYAFWGWLILIAMIIATTRLLYETKNLQSDLPILIFPALCILLAIFLILYQRNHIIYFNEETIIAQSWRRKAIQINWSNISKVKFSAFRRQLIVYGQSKKISISPSARGFNTFFEILERQTIYSADKLKIPGAK